MGRRKTEHRPLTINDCLFLDYLGFKPILRNGHVIAVVPKKEKATYKRG